MTPQASLFDRAGSVEFSETWPLSGTMRSGNVFQRPPLAPRTFGTGFSLWPTPIASEERGEAYTEVTSVKHFMTGSHQVHLGQMIRHGLTPATRAGRRLDRHSSEALYLTPTASMAEASNGRGAETTTHDTVRRLREMGVIPSREMVPTPTTARDGTMFPTLTASARIDRGEQVMLAHVVNEEAIEPM